MLAGPHCVNDEEGAYSQEVYQAPKQKSTGSDRSVGGQNMIQRQVGHSHGGSEDRGHMEMRVFRLISEIDVFQGGLPGSISEHR